MRLPDVFGSKLPLRFRNDGTFRILMMSDMHYAPDRDERTVKAIELLLDTQKPDLVILGGDNTTGKATKKEFRILLEDIVRPMEDRRIPWAHIFGNHDISPKVSKEYQQRIYELYPHCVSKAGPKSLPGGGNYFLPVMDADGTPVFGVWALDSHQDFKTPSAEFGYKGDMYWDLLMPGKLGSGADWEFVRFEQIMSYWKTSEFIEQTLGRKLPSLMVIHIPLPEFNALLLNSNRTCTTGEYNERVSASEINSGLFAAALQRGDVKAIYAGHDHINTFDGIYCGIRMGFDGSAGYHAYGCRDNDPGKDRERLRGGRVFDININDPWAIDTHMVFIKDLL